MSGIKQHYIKALLTLIKEGEESVKVFSHLEKVMKKRGHSALLLPVLKSALRELSGRSVTLKPRLTIAKESEVSRYSKKYKDAEVVVDETIIGGYVYEENGTRLDQSYKTKLLNWYYKAINN